MYVLSLLLKKRTNNNTQRQRQLPQREPCRYRHQRRRPIRTFRLRRHGRRCGDGPHDRGAFGGRHAPPDAPFVDESLPHGLAACPWVGCGESQNHTRHVSRLAQVCRTARRAAKLAMQTGCRTEPRTCCRTSTVLTLYTKCGAPPSAFPQGPK